MANTNIRVIADREELVAIADAVREKTGKSEDMSLGAIVHNIRGMSEAVGGTTLDLDAEITEQEAKIAAQDTIIADIASALEGKAASGGNNVDLITTTVSEEEAEWVASLTINELIGAKYFIIQGNPLTVEQFQNVTMANDAGTIHQLIYLDGIIYIYVFDFAGYNKTDITCISSPDIASFDSTTGTISVESESSAFQFMKISTDTSTTGNVYTVYRLG